MGWFIASSWPPLPYTHKQGKPCIHWFDKEPACNAILEFIPCYLKKSRLLDICCFFGAKTNYDHNLNKEDAKNDDSVDDYSVKTYCLNFCLGSAI